MVLGRNRSPPLQGEVQAPPLQRQHLWHGSPPHALLRTTCFLSPGGPIPADKAVWKSSLLCCADLPHERHITTLKVYDICIYSNAIMTIDLHTLRVCCTGSKIFLLCFFFFFFSLRASQRIYFFYSALINWLLDWI